MTDTELSDVAKGCIPEVCSAFRQVFAFLIWWDDVRPVHERLLSDPALAFRFHTIRNAAMENTLLYIRKINEILSPGRGKHSDDLRAVDFGYAVKTNLFDSKHIRELHKRVMHPTTRSATHGEGGWEIHAALKTVTGSALLFLRHLEERLDPSEEELCNQVEFTKDFVMIQSMRMEEIETQEAGTQQPSPRDSSKAADGLTETRDS